MAFRAEIIFYEKLTLASGRLKEAIIWKVPRSEKYPDGIEYRLALVEPSSRKVLVLYDNHYPKGHHKHELGKEEVCFKFESLKKLVREFLSAVELADR